jgi:hypothetical protein
MHLTDYIAWVPMIVLIVVLGVWPNAIFKVTDDAVCEALAPTGRVALEVATGDEEAAHADEVAASEAGGGGEDEEGETGCEVQAAEDHAEQEAPEGEDHGG